VAAGISDFAGPRRCQDGGAAVVGVRTMILEGGGVVGGGLDVGGGV
jgi:hypothetical protein